MANNIESSKDVVTFQLPDNDNVVLISWNFVLSKLEEKLSPMLNSIESINSDLQKINNRVDTWIEEQKEDE